MAISPWAVIPCSAGRSKHPEVDGDMNRLFACDFVSLLTRSSDTKFVASCLTMKSFRKLVAAGLVFLVGFMFPAATAWPEIPWDVRQLAAPPRVYPAPGFHEEGVRAFFFEGPPWQGKPTRIFAWYGAPLYREAQTVPALVLVHGGGGTAFASWVRLWNSRGYAAIAIDTCGNLPIPAENHGWQRNPNGGPPCWDASFDQIDWPEKDQWTYQAVAAIILANSLLRSFPEIDSKRIGITGISWGGYLTAISASVDRRFRFAALVYGCGFLGEDSYWLPQFRKMGDAKSHKWLTLWDPSVYLRKAKMPFLWVDGTNDEFYPLDSLKKSYLLPQGPRTFSIRVRMPHNHEEGEQPDEIRAFADHLLQSGAPLASVRVQSRRGLNVWMSYRTKVPIVRAELNFTSDSGIWRQRQWNTVAAELDPGKHEVRATLPESVTAYYFNLLDERGLIVSSDLQISGVTPR